MLEFSLLGLTLFQHISGHIWAVSVCHGGFDNQFSSARSLSHCVHQGILKQSTLCTRRTSYLYDIPSHIMLTTGQPVLLLLNYIYTLYVIVSCIGQGRLNYQLEICGFYEVGNRTWDPPDT